MWGMPMEIEQHRRSREGAWIEIEALGQEGIFIPVAPVRELGLKWLALPKSWKLSSRSREGAWIEIPAQQWCRR